MAADFIYLVFDNDTTSTKQPGGILLADSPVFLKWAAE
jgi:hypothetical protein